MNTQNQPVHPSHPTQNHPTQNHPENPALSDRPQDHRLDAENARRTELYRNDPLRIKNESERTFEKDWRERYLAINPEQRTQVDNNLAKVMIFVDKTSHSVPPGPLTVETLKTMVRLPGTGLSMNGRFLDNDTEQITLNGGEVFISDYFHFDYLSDPADPTRFYLGTHSNPAEAASRGGKDHNWSRAAA